MKVLLVHPKVPMYGGAERVIVKLCEYLRDHDIEHALAMPKIPELMALDLAGTKCFDHIPVYSRFNLVNYHNFPATLESLYSFGQSLHQVWYCNEPPELFTRWDRKPVEALNRWLVKHYIKNVVVADKFNAGRFFKMYDVIPKVIPYGIDYEFFSDCTNYPDPEYFTVLQVGTISRYKNQIATVQAIASIKEYVPNIRAWFVGNVSEPDYRAELEGAVQGYGLGGRVSFEPHVTRQHLRYLYSMANVLMHPVREQGGWLSPFEAISAGCPVITSEELTCSDMIAQNQLALVSRDYAAALKLVYEHPEQVLAITAKAREWVADNLTWDKFGESMVNYFEEVIGCQKSLSQVAKASLAPTSANSSRVKAGK